MLVYLVWDLFEFYFGRLAPFAVKNVVRLTLPSVKTQLRSLMLIYLCCDLVCLNPSLSLRV